MRILNVIPSIDPKLGGVSAGLRNTIPELNKLGAINEVVCFDDPEKDFLTNTAFKTYALGKALGPWSYNKLLKPWLNLNLKNYDIVIIHGLWLYHSYGTYLAIEKYRIKNPNTKLKTYLMTHGMLDPWFQKAPGRKLKSIRNWIFWKLIESNVVNGVDGILFTCEQELLLARKSFSPYNPNKELNIGYGIKEPPTHNIYMDQSFSAVYPDFGRHPYLLFFWKNSQKKGSPSLNSSIQIP